MSRRLRSHYGTDEILRSTTAAWKSSPDNYLIGDHDGYLAMLKFYGDDSFGRNESGSQGCCVVAGYFTDSTVWKTVAGEWRAVLDAAPKIAYFRMREYVSRCNGDDEESGQFLSLSKADSEMKFDRLISVLENNGRWFGLIESIATWDMFNHALTDEWRAVFKSPYTLCVLGILQGCHAIMDRIGGFKPVDFTFDEQSGFETLLLESWKLWKGRFPPEYADFMSRIGFANDKDYIPLQCADLLAWHVRRQYIRPIEDRGKPRPAYLRLKNSVPDYARAEGRLNESTIRRIVQKLDQMPGT